MPLFSYWCYLDSQQQSILLILSCNHEPICLYPGNWNCQWITQGCMRGSQSLIIHGVKIASQDHVVVVQSLSRVWLFETPWTRVCQASLSLTISQCLPKFMSIESVMLSKHLILCLDHVQTYNLDFINLESQPDIQMLRWRNISLDR